MERLYLWSGSYRTHTGIEILERGFGGTGIYPRRALEAEARMVQEMLLQHKCRHWDIQDRCRRQMWGSQ